MKAQAGLADALDESGRSAEAGAGSHETVQKMQRQESAKDTSTKSNRPRSRHPKRPSHLVEHANSLFARLLFLPFVAVMVMLGCDAKAPASDAPDASGPTPAQQPARGTRSAPPAVRSAPAAAAEPPTRVQQAPAGAPQAEGSAQKTPLCLDLQAPRDEVLFGEPLSLVVSLVNCSPVEQQVDDLLSPDFGFLQVLMRPPDDKDQLYRPITKRDARGKRTRPLAPGDRLSALVPVYASADGWTLTRPGRYAFRAALARCLETRIQVRLCDGRSAAERSRGPGGQPHDEPRSGLVSRDGARRQG